MHLRQARRGLWHVVIRRRTRIETMVNDAMASFMREGIEPTKRQVCERIGYDYDDVDDRNAVSLAIAANKRYIDIAYREAFIPLGQWDAAYQRAADDVAGYNEWKRKDPDFVRHWYGMGWSDQDLHEVWIHYQIWEEFLRTANRWNLHVFIAEGTPYRRNGFRYKQPNFWDYIVKQIDVGRRLQKGVLTTLERHQLLGMILTSGEPVEQTIRVAQDSLQMISDGAPLRYRCENCEEQGLLVAFRSQRELVEHYRNAHGS